MEKLKWLLSFVFGGIATFLGQYGVMIILVALVIVFDVITGLIKCKVSDIPITSNKGTKGFFKKMAFMVCLFFGFFLDYAIPYMGSRIALDIQFNMPFGMIICFYIILNESISICENLYACNDQMMPKWIVKVLKLAKDKIDDGGKQYEDIEKK